MDLDRAHTGDPPAAEPRRPPPEPPPDRRGRAWVHQARAGLLDHESQRFAAEPAKPG